MSKIFNVTLDYLLNEEGTQTSDTATERGIYVSRELADGSLLYQKRKFLKIAIAVGIMVGSLALSDISMLLFMQILIIGIVFCRYHCFNCWKGYHGHRNIFMYLYVRSCSGVPIAHYE